MTNSIKEQSKEHNVGNLVAQLFAKGIKDRSVWENIAEAVDHQTYLAAGRWLLAKAEKIETAAPEPNQAQLFAVVQAIKIKSGEKDSKVAEAIGLFPASVEFGTFADFYKQAAQDIAERLSEFGLKAPENVKSDKITAKQFADGSILIERAWAEGNTTYSAYGSAAEVAASKSYYIGQPTKGKKVLFTASDVSTLADHQSPMIKDAGYRAFICSTFNGGYIRHLGRLAHEECNAILASVRYGSSERAKLLTELTNPELIAADLIYRFKSISDKSREATLRSVAPNEVAKTRVVEAYQGLAKRFAGSVPNTEGITDPLQVAYVEDAIRCLLEKEGIIASTETAGGAV